MKKILLVFVTVVIAFSIFFPIKIYALESKIVSADVVETVDITQSKGITQQTVKVKLRNGQFANAIETLTIELKSNNWGILKPGDRIRVYQLQNEDNQMYIQFAGYERSNLLLPLFLLLFAIIGAVLGQKGLKNLMPSLIILILFVTRILEQVILDKNALFYLLLILIPIIAGTAFWRIRDLRLTLMVTFSVSLSILAGILIASGFAQVLNASTVINLNDINNFLEVKSIGEFFGLIAAIITLGPTINIAIQVAKYMHELFLAGTNDLRDLLKEGFRIGQKAAAGELNNFWTVFIGLNLFSFILVYYTYNASLGWWNNPWIVGQSILFISTSLSILLVAPCSILVTTLILKFVSQRKKTQLKLDLN